MHDIVIWLCWDFSSFSIEWTNISSIHQEGMKKEYMRRHRFVQGEAPGPKGIPTSKTLLAGCKYYFDQDLYFQGRTSHPSLILLLSLINFFYDNNYIYKKKYLPSLQKQENVRNKVQDWRPSIIFFKKKEDENPFFLCI